MPCIFLVLVRVLTGGLEGESSAFLFPLRGTGKRNRGIDRMCAPVDERAPGAFDEDSIPFEQNKKATEW